MSRYRRHKDAAHPGVVAALLGAGALVTVLEGARWAGGGRKQQNAGAPDLYATLRGTTVALEVKSPGASKARREDMDQKAFACAAALAGLQTFQVQSPLEALAVLGCTPVEARRGLVAAEYAGRKGGMGHTLPAQAGDIHLSEVESMLSEARQRLHLAAAPPPAQPLDFTARPRSAVVRTHDGAPPKK